MKVTSTMIRKLQEAMGSGTDVTLDIQPGGCRVTASWNGGLSNMGITLGVAGVDKLSTYGGPEMQKAWDRLIDKFVAAKEQGKATPLQ